MCPRCVQVQSCSRASIFHHFVNPTLVLLLLQVLPLCPIWRSAVCQPHPLNDVFLALGPKYLFLSSHVENVYMISPACLLATYSQQTLWLQNVSFGKMYTHAAWIGITQFILFQICFNLARLELKKFNLWETFNKRRKFCTQVYI